MQFQHERIVAETASIALERDSLQQKSLQLEAKVKELADIVLAQGRDLEGSLRVIDNAVERTEVEHKHMNDVLAAERAAASLLLDSALRDRDALHKAAMSEKERWYDSKIEEAQMAAALSNSKLREAHEKAGRGRTRRTTSPHHPTGRRDQSAHPPVLGDQGASRRREV